jgi:hypothetical protein
MAHFKLETELSGLMCSFDEGQELEFRYKSPTPVFVSFKQRKRDGEDRPARIGDAICTALTVRDIDPDVCSEVHQAIENDMVNVGKLKHRNLEIIDDCFFHLRDVSRSTVILFNWIHGLDGLPDPLGRGPPDPLGRGHALYSEDGERWLRVPRSTSGSLNVDLATLSISARSAQIEEVVRKVEAGAEEPLARQVFREAWNQIVVNPRSALVIGVSAAEVGLRGLIGSLIPDAKWLVDEIQTPPVGRILRKFLPTLPVKAKWADGRPITLPSELIKLIEKAFVHRNAVVHVGAPPPSRKELVIMLRAIRDFLWICDVYLGERWAMEHVSLETKKYWQAKGS